MLGDQRWVEVTPSAYEHERAGLQILRELLPDVPPFRVWTNFEFKDSQGRWHEIDALVLGRSRLHLVELKYYSGDLHGNDLRWHRGQRVEDSPLLLARRKAQRLKQKLKDAAAAFAREKNVDPRKLTALVPYIQESVFLHHPGIRSHLDRSAASGIFGLDGHEQSTSLDGISQRLLELPPADRDPIGDNASAILTAIMAHLGLAERREPTAGTWNLIEPYAETDAWQDWTASHTLIPDKQARIRFHLTPPGADPSQQAETRRLVTNEYRVMSGLHHDGLLRPEEMVDAELGLGLVYPLDPQAQRLDLWLAGKGDALPMAQRLAIVRQAAETVHYAHRNRVVHRDLTPHALWVTEGPSGLKVKVGDWQSAGNATLTTTAATGVTALQAQTTDDPSAGYRAPEGAWSPTANRIRIDVFGLAATAYFILTGVPPATSAADLRGRLRDQGGLDLGVDLPQVPSPLRTLILAATHPRAAERTGDVGAFLEGLTAAEQALTEPDTEPALDPLEARPGDLLDGRFRLQRRLGAGSTAVGLLVTDESARNVRRVLKVALEDRAGARLPAEADVLSQLPRTPRIVQLIEPPLVIGGRVALLLSFAGTQTLGERLSERQRLSLDLLARWGDDLLEALDALDRAGLDHRDIKPANLGVHQSPPDRLDHLVLFDFSASRAPASDLETGTVPYLDPFLGSGRSRFDAAAERYAAAVVLFEMATGCTPVYGADSSAHPGSVSDEVTLTRELFDPTVADGFLKFFRTALARDAAERHSSVAQMRRQWQQALTPGTTTTAEAGNDQAAAATVDTPLTESGLTPRALSMLEPTSIETVGQLIAVDLVWLNRFPGVARATRTEVVTRVRAWRKRLGTGTPAPPPSLLPSLDEASHTLVAAADAGRSKNRSRLLHTLLGENPDVDPFATQSAIALALALTSARISQLIADLQASWGADDAARQLFTDLDQLTRARIRELGGVVTVDELVDTLIAAMPPTDGLATQGRVLVCGLLRVLSDRQRQLAEADPDHEVLFWRRRGGVMCAVAESPQLLDVAESLGAAADQVVVTSPGALVPAARAYAELRPLAERLTDPPQALLAQTRLAELAAGLATQARASAQGELHTADLPLAQALALALGSVAPSQALAPQELVQRVKARFPALPPLSVRELDQIVADSGLDLVWDETTRRYVSRLLTEPATGLGTRPQTALPADEAPISAAGVVGQRLLDSRRSRSFLVLGVPADQLDRMTAVATGPQFRAREINVTKLLLQQMRAVNAEMKRPVPWEEVRRADAAPAHAKAGLGLRALVGRAVDRVVAEINAQLAAPQPWDSPILLTDAAPLGRYGHTKVLAQWSDLSRPRGQAVWLLVPKLAGRSGALLDGHPVQSSSNQFVPVDRVWIGRQWAELDREGVSA